MNPIDTAPKDGTEILLFTPGYGWRQGKWDPWREGDEDPWKFKRYASDGCGCCGYDNAQPTGWLPLSILSE